MSRVAEAFPVDRQPNHCLINEYLPGQGIMPHTDGPAFHPLISTLSLGSHTLLDLYKPLEDGAESGLAERWQSCLLLERRSLVLLTDQLYAHRLHGINLVKRDTIREPPLNRQLLARPPLQDEVRLQTVRFRTFRYDSGFEMR